MVDISKCNGNGCPIKTSCYRFTSVASEYMQSYVITPWKRENGLFSCSMFWGENQTTILDQLKEITNTKKQTK